MTDDPDDDLTAAYSQLAEALIAWVAEMEKAVRWPATQQQDAPDDR